MKLMITQRRVNMEMLLPPYFSFCLVYCVVVLLIAAIRHVAIHQDCVGILGSDFLHQQFSDLGVGHLCIGWIGKSLVSISYNLCLRTDLRLRNSKGRTSLTQKGRSGKILRARFFAL